MKLVKLTRDLPSRGVFSGEVVGLDDAEADSLVSRGRAAYAPVEPEPEPTSAEPEPAEAAAEPAEEPAVDDEGEDDEDEQPVRRGPGRPRRHR